MTLGFLGSRHPQSYSFLSREAAAREQDDGAERSSNLSGAALLWSDSRMD